MTAPTVRARTYVQVHTLTPDDVSVCVSRRGPSVLLGAVTLYFDSGAELTAVLDEVTRQLAAQEREAAESVAG